MGTVFFIIVLLAYAVIGSVVAAVHKHKFPPVDDCDDTYMIVGGLWGPIIPCLVACGALVLVVGAIMLPLWFLHDKTFAYLQGRKIPKAIVKG